jgi:YidC/Oxa1 family membrane protein insertase
MLLALGLSFALTAIYMTWFMPKPVPPAPEPAKVETVPKVEEKPPPAPAGATAAAPKAPRDAPPARKVRWERKEIELVLNNAGGGLSEAKLLGEKMKEQPQLSPTEGFKRLFSGRAEDAPQIDMALPFGNEPLPLALSIASPVSVPPTQAYFVEELPDGAVKFTTSEGPFEISKTFKWPDASRFDFSVAVEIKNTGSEPVSGEWAMFYSRGVHPGTEAKHSFFGGVGNESAAVCNVGEDMHQLLPDGKADEVYQGPVNFFGINQPYFLAAVYPLDGAKDGKCSLAATAAGRVSKVSFPLNLAPGAKVEQRFGVFIGPKDLDLLRGLPQRLGALGSQVRSEGDSGFSFNASSYPHLERSVDFGIWAFICKVLLAILNFFFGLINNWGVAIILLTVVVKIVLLPLTHKSMVSAEAMKKLQPKMEEIRKKYSEDRERQNIEMMKLYQEAKVNPLGGCLPLLLQMPVWIALYTALRNSYEIYREPFIAPIWSDLTYRDPTYLLPILLGVTQIITTKLQPQMMDAMQARLMTYFMPIFFTVIMLNYPAGLSLYIFTNNILSIGQQYGLRKYLEKKGIASAPKPAEKNARRDGNERHSGRKRSAS